MKIKEMIFMILALVVFFVIVLLFWLSVTLGDIKGDVAQSSRDRNIMLVARLADSPELSCGLSNCIDTDKLIVFMGRPHYLGFWDVNGLIVEKLDSANNTVECTLGNYPRCNTFTIKKPLNNTIPDSSIVSLCRKEIKNDISYEKCDMGRIKVWSKI